MKKSINQGLLMLAILLFTSLIVVAQDNTKTPAPTKTAHPKKQVKKEVKEVKKQGKKVVKAKKQEVKNDNQEVKNVKKVKKEEVKEAKQEVKEDKAEMKNEKKEVKKEVTEKKLEIKPTDEQDKSLKGPNGETVYTSARGGKYYFNKNGNKVFITPDDK
jgi:colicin import membrane protein